MRWIALVFALFAAPLTAANTGSLDEIVSADYPSELIDFLARHKLNTPRQQTYIPISINGTDYVVAAYSTGGTTGTGIGALVLLERNSGTYRRDDKVRRPLVGVNPELTAVDVDGDGRPEIELTFDIGKGGSETWLFRISDGHFVNIGPRNAQGGSLLSLPHLVDMEGNGILDIVQDSNVGSRQEPTTIHSHYTLRNGFYAAVEPLDYFATFYRESGKPAVVSDHVTIMRTALNRPYRLTVLNGGGSGVPFRAASGTIALNSIVISGPSDFSESRAAWSVPVTLADENTISVTLGGKPKARIAIAIRHD